MNQVQIKRQKHAGRLWADFRSFEVDADVRPQANCGNNSGKLDLLAETESRRGSPKPRSSPLAYAIMKMAGLRETGRSIDGAREAMGLAF